MKNRLLISRDVESHLYMLAFLGDVQGSMLKLTIPIMAYYVEATPFEVGLIGGSVDMVKCFAPSILGKVSDLFRRKRMLAISFLIYGAVSATYLLSSTPLQLIGLGVLLGIAQSILWPTIEALIADMNPKSMDKALRKYNVAWSVAWIIGPPMAGAMLGVLGSSPIFVIAVLISSCGALTTLKSVKEPLSMEDHIRTELSSLEPSSLEKMGTLTLVFLSAFILGNLQSIFPFQAVSLGIAPLMVGLIVLSLGLTRVLAFIGMPFISELATSSWVKLLSAGLLAVSMVPLALEFPRETLMVRVLLVFMLAGLGAGLTFAVSLSLMLRGDNTGRGFRAGFFESFMGMGYFTGPILGGILAGYGFGVPYLFCLVLGVSVASLQFAVMRVKTG